MNVQLCCPKCESRRDIQQYTMFVNGLFLVRECKECKTLAAIPTTSSQIWKETNQEDKIRALDWWKNWECVCIPGSSFLASKLKAREIFEKNEMKRKQS